jgi:hypothetical protein
MGPAGPAGPTGPDGPAQAARMMMANTNVAVRAIVFLMDIFTFSLACCECQSMKSHNQLFFRTAPPSCQKLPNQHWVKVHITLGL